LRAVLRMLNFNYLPKKWHTSCVHSDLQRAHVQRSPSSPKERLKWLGRGFLVQSTVVTKASYPSA
jgi:hypothetical protein